MQIITQNKLFHRLAFTLQGIIVNIQAVFWLQKGTEAADILTTCAQLWIMVHALAFSLLVAGCDFESGAEIPGGISVTAERDLSGD
ncbi:hypothetical protein ACLK1Z_03470 [Escherichia coli]